MESYLLSWVGLVLRWTHFIVGIAWIGSSFYFMWLDARLARPPQNPESDRVAGDLWSVHGGGFYHAQKYQLAPARMPESLHWFKWEAYATWLTGFALLVVFYYFNASLYLIDTSVRDLSPGGAVAISLGVLILSWPVYDGLCRLRLTGLPLFVAGLALLGALAYGLAEVFSGRGVYMQIGATLGTLMVANVAHVIIPGQRKIVAALMRGEEPDPEPGLRGKQRSTHNNYMTLPVLFMMISSHYPLTWSHRHAVAVLVALFGIGALVRHFFNLRNSGRSVPALLGVALLGVLVLVWLVRPPPPATTAGAVAEAGISVDVIAAIARDRCVTCHARSPTHVTAPVAPKGVMLESNAQIEQWADAIHQQTVVTRAMPLANLTTISEEERALIDAWYRARSPE